MSKKVVKQRKAKQVDLAKQIDFLVAERVREEQARIEKSQARALKKAKELAAEHEQLILRTRVVKKQIAKLGFAFVGQQGIDESISEIEAMDQKATVIENLFGDHAWRAMHVSVEGIISRTMNEIKKEKLQ